MYSEEALTKIFEAAEKLQNGRMGMPALKLVFSQLGLEFYDPKIKNRIKEVNTYIGSQIIDSLDLQGFLVIVKITRNFFDSILIESIIAFRAVENSFINNKDFNPTNRDRESAADFLIKVGDETKYNNSLKIWAKALDSKQLSEPWLSLYFYHKTPEAKDQMASVIINIIDVVKGFATGQKPEMEEEFKLIEITTDSNEQGTEVTFKLKHEKTAELQKAFHSLVATMFKKPVNGSLEFNLGFNKDLKSLFDPKNRSYFFSIMEQDAEISFTWSFGRIISALKELLRVSGSYVDLVYDALYMPALLTILFTNLEKSTLRIELDNMTPETRPPQAEYQQAIQETQEVLQDIQEQGLKDIFAQFGIDKLLGMLGDQIKVEANIGKYSVGADVQVKDLCEVLGALFNLGGEREGSEGSDDS